MQRNVTARERNSNTRQRNGSAEGKETQREKLQSQERTSSPQGTSDKDPAENEKPHHKKGLVVTNDMNGYMSDTCCMCSTMMLGWEVTAVDG